MRFGLSLIVVLQLTWSLPAVAADSKDVSLVLVNARAIVDLAPDLQPLSARDVEILRDKLSKRHAADEITAFLWTKAQFEIDINPEARLSLWRTEVPLSMPPCGRAVNWLVRIENDSHVTTIIDVISSSSGAAGSVSVQFPGGRLSGGTHEFRTLRLSLSEAGPIDVTLSVKSSGNGSDLVNRGEVPLLFRCGADPAPGVAVDRGEHRHH